MAQKSSVNISPADVIKHQQYAAAHLAYEKLYQWSRDRFLQHLGKNLMLTIGDYVLVRKVSQRRALDQKLLVMEEPKLFSKYVKETAVTRLMVSGPEAPALQPDVCPHCGALLREDAA